MRAREIDAMLARLLGIVLALGAGGSMLQSAVAGSAPAVDFSGTWVLNTSLSDDLEDKIREVNDQRRAVEAGRQPGVGFGDEPGGLWQRGSGNPQAFQMQMNRLAAGIERLVITFVDPELSIRFADGRSRVLNTDGKKMKQETEFGKTLSRAKWKKDGRLVVITTSEWGRQLSEMFRLGPLEGQLSITTRLMPTDREAGIEFNRVYDRVQDSTADEGLTPVEDTEPRPAEATDDNGGGP